MSQNPSTSPSGLIAMSCVLPVLSIAAIGLRFWLRGRQKSHLKIDDWLMVPALALFIGMCICAILGVRKRAWGYPNLDPNDGIEAYDICQIYEGQLLEAFQFIQIVALGCIKLGALFFYCRIFSVGLSRATFNTTLHLCIAFTILWTIAMTVMNAVQCGSHVSALWTPPVENYLKYCIYVFPFLNGFAISNFLLDLLILALPIPKIWSLHASTARKSGLTGVFGLATMLVTCPIYLRQCHTARQMLTSTSGLAASAVRMGTYIHLTEDGPSATADAHLEDTETVFWSNLEGGLSLLAVNLPSLWAIRGNLSSPVSQMIASIRSALSLRSFGSNSHHSPGGGGGVNSVNTYTDDSQVRIHEPSEEQSGERHRLDQINSLGTEVNAPRVSDGTDYDAKRAKNHDSVV